ncbi:MAG: hypothetical protein Q9224_001548, partial [Gallowayella concinna]
MADEHRIFLAQKLLNEALIASLSPSRGLQNSKKPGSVHAVYLITGFIVPTTSAASTQVEQANGEDTHMRSSPFMSSSMPQRQDDEEQSDVKTITICREEDLQEVKARYNGKLSIHVYSLAPGTIQDMHILSDCNRAAAAQCATEDPLQAGRQYGTIQNARVKVRRVSDNMISTANIARLQRRTGPRPSPAQSSSITGRDIRRGKASTPAAKVETKFAKAEIPKALQGQASGRGEVKLKNEVRQKSSQEKKPATKAPTMKREQSDIFKSFSKPQPKLSRENTQSSTGASPTPKVVRVPNKQNVTKVLTGVEQETPIAEDVPSIRDDASMDDASDNEQMEDTVGGSEETAHIGRNTRFDREDQLRRLWDDDATAENTPMETPKTDSDHQDPEQLTVEPPAQHSEQVVTAPSAASGSRRRGRRKIMKKKTLKDDEGYL